MSDVLASARVPIAVWWFDLDQPPKVVERLADVLEPSERTRAARFRTDVLRYRYVVAHAALRQILGHALGREPHSVPLERDPCTACGALHGKPRVTDATISFNLSHGGRAGVVAIADRAMVGVDVEPVDAFQQVGALGSWLTPGEADALAVCSPSTRLAAELRAWVRKEAALKATGEGLNRPLDQCAILPDRRPAWTAVDDSGIPLARGVDVAIAPDVVVGVAVDVRRARSATVDLVVSTHAWDVAHRPDATERTDALTDLTLRV